MRKDMIGVEPTGNKERESMEKRGERRTKEEMKGKRSTGKEREWNGEEMEEKERKKKKGKVG